MQEFKKHFGAGEKIHVEMINGYDKHQYVSQIVENYDNGIFDILTPVHKSRIVYFSNASIIKISTVKGAAIYEVEAKVLEKTFGRIPMMRLVVASNLNKVQRRDFYRLRTIVDISIRRAINLNEKKFGEKFSGTALDISAGGLLLNTNKDLEENDLLEMTLNLISERELVLFGIIVRKQYNSVTRFSYEYGIKFQNVSDFEKNEITKFIFEEQRKLIKKGLV